MQQAYLALPGVLALFGVLNVLLAVDFRDFVKDHTQCVEVGDPQLRRLRALHKGRTSEHARNKQLNKSPAVR